MRWGVLPIGAGLGGFAAELTDVPTMFGAGAVASVVLALLFLATVSSAELRRAVAAEASV